MGDEQAIRIGLLGCGTVGTGVLRILRDNAADIRARLGVPVEVTRIAVADRAKARDPVVPTDRVTTDPREVVEDPDVQVVVEVMGGYDPARELILASLRKGRHVVTANKALLARHGAEIFQVADEVHRDVIFEASVGGGIPIIRMLREGLASDRVDTLHAIINGTSNFILTAMSEEGATYGEALSQAQELGYAEADPTMDVGGIDAAQKLSILIALAYGSAVSFDEILTHGIDRVTAADIRFAEAFGYAIKPLAIARAHEDGLEARVHPALMPEDSMLGSVKGVFNAVYLQSAALGPMMFYGQGAGQLPTAAAVVSDVIEQGRNILRGTSGRIPHLAFHEGFVPRRVLRPAAETRCPFYLRFPVSDEPGVLASIAGTLGEHGISISRMIQDDLDEQSPIQIVMITHTAREGDVLDALEVIDAKAFMREPPHYLRIEELR
ncbi:MAG: homoserine dehydrogenase [Myxococcota bacterium]